MSTVKAIAMEMSELFWSILQYGWTALGALVVWAVRKLLFLEKRFEMIEREAVLREEHRHELSEQGVRAENAARKRTDEILSRISSIEEFLRNGSRSG